MGGLGVSGATPLVSIRDALDTTRYLDFADSIFKTGGWTMRQATLLEVALASGQYQRVLDLALISDAVDGFSFVAEYFVDNGANVRGIALEVFTVDDTHELQRAVLLGESVAAPGNPGSLIVKRPGAGTPFITYELRDFLGASVLGAPGVPARRSPGVVTP